MQDFARLMQSLSPHESVLDADRLVELRESIKALETDLAAAREENRNLRIAVVGQMKAGKSSFLNAAFFGCNLLPQADTPMTATLTKIVHAEQPRAEVVFYSESDWREIERRAAEYAQRYPAEEDLLTKELADGAFGKGRRPTPQEVEARIPHALRASHELVAKAHEQGLDVHAFLGQTKVLDGFGDTADSLARQLREFVGSGGRYTPITKMTVLHVNDPRLEGLEIIDTPGFNDPVVSRGQQTREFLRQCDVVFLLSIVSQLLTSADVALLREQLPEAGIDEKAVILVGSQRDVALRQDRGIANAAERLAAKRPQADRAATKVHAMFQLLDLKMTGHVRTTLAAFTDDSALDKNTRAVLCAVQRAHPRFISSWAWLVADQFAELSQDDREQLAGLCRDTGFTFDPENLRALSNIPTVRNDVLEQRKHKTELLAGKEALLMEGVRAKAQRQLRLMSEELATQAERIRTRNITELLSLERETVKRLQRGRAAIEGAFDEEICRAVSGFAVLKTEIRAQAREYSKLNVVRERRTESKQVSTSKIWNPFSWFSSETVYYDVVTVYASAQDAVDQVQVFVSETVRALQRAIRECVDLKLFRESVGRAAMSLFDTGSADFDSDLLMSQVERSLRRITIPEIHLGQKDYSEAIFEQFGGEQVSERRVAGLRQAQRSAVKAVVGDLEREVSERVDEIGERLGQAGAEFVDGLTSDIRLSLEKLRADIADKDNALRRIDSARRAVEMSQEALASDNAAAA